ncbi:MAG: TolC family protein [Bryobacteraceae bacterium]
MQKLSFFTLSLSCFAVFASAEVKTMTLRQAVDLALAQNPDVLIARLDQQKARGQVTIQRDPFVPKMYAGSGIAYTNGFPATIDGSAPSIVQARANMAIFNRPQSYMVAQAEESVRGAGAETARRQEDVVYRVITLWLDAEQAARSLEAAQRQGVNLLKVRELMEQRVAEGRELPLEGKKANLAVLRANQAADSLALNLVNTETSLALMLGLNPGDRVHAAAGQREPIEVPVTEDASIEQALTTSNELKSLESSMQAKRLEVKSYQAERLPKINLLAQYSLLGKFNNYEEFFRSFQRHNGQIGASIEIPLLVGHAANAQRSAAELEIAKLRIEVGRTRSRITADLRTGYQNLKRADAARDVARADLDVAREELNIDLALMDEGRLPLARVEAARATENEKWLAYYDAQHGAELARINVLRYTGTLAASIH